jgi:hypothetical protein
VYYALRRLIRRPITSKFWESQRTGFIYVLTTRQEQGSGRGNIVVKVGVTAGNDIKTRMKAIKQKCRHYDLEVVADEEQIAIPGYFRAEALVHQELSKSRLQTARCPLDKAQQKEPDAELIMGDDVEVIDEADKHRHKEWFNVPPDEAVKIVQRWRKFMLQRPYDIEGNLKGEFQSRLNYVILPPPLPADYKARERILRTLLQERYTPYVWQFVAATMIHRVLTSPIASLVAVLLNMFLRDIEAEYDVAWMINGMINYWWRCWRPLEMMAREEIKYPQTSLESCEVVDRDIHS